MSPTLPRRLLLPGSALLWGLQTAFLIPSLALILVTLYDATPAQVGAILTVYNAAGFVATLVLPAWADRRRNYLGPALGCGALTLVLALVLSAVSSLPVAVVALVVLGGPAGVGSGLLFAHLRHVGTPPAAFLRVRAMVSLAWVAGPPLATLLVGLLGNRAILMALAAVAVLNVATTALLRRSNRPDGTVEQAPTSDPPAAMPKRGVIVIVAGFVALQATNVAAVSVMSLYVTRYLGLDIAWAGVALGVAAIVEIPTLIVIGKLNERFSSTALIVSGCLAGLVYYAGLTLVRGPVLLLVLQVLSAWFIAAVAGVGLTFFMDIVPRPGLAAGLAGNARRLGAVAAGPIVALASVGVLGGYGLIFVVCAALSAIGAGTLLLAVRISRRAVAEA